MPVTNPRLFTDGGLGDEWRRTYPHPDREMRLPTFPYRSGVEIHLPGERWVSPNTQVEPVLHASVCGKPE